MRPATILFLILFAFAPSPAPAQAPAQDPASPDQLVLVQAPSAATAQTGVPDPSLAAQAGSGLPQPNTEARTMRAYWHVFIAFGVVWLLLFGYALTVGRRFGKLEEEVRRLRGTP
jgi:CcmD family protein